MRFARALIITMIYKRNHLNASCGKTNMRLLTVGMEKHLKKVSLHSRIYIVLH
jgi:hypothetical protein